MLSFDKGRPVAAVVGGKYDGKTLHVMEELEPVESLEELENDPFFKLNRERYTLKELAALRQSYGETKDLNADLLKIYNHSRRSFLIDDGILEPLPAATPERLYVAGASGSGKSTFIGKYMKRYKEMYAKNPIYVFSRNVEDPAIDSVENVRIRIDDELISEEPLGIDELYDSLCVFDDITTIPQEPLKKEVIRIREDLLECGRKAGIYCAVSNHNLLDYKKTRELLNEATSVTFFPKGGGGISQIIGFLKNHAGMDKREIKEIRNLPSRWVSIYRTYPTFIMHERGLYLL